MSVTATFPRSGCLPLAAVLLCVLGAGCRGVVQDADGTTDLSSTPPGQSETIRPGPDPSCQAPNVEAGALARLTAGEYQRTVTDLLGRDPQLSFPLAADEEAGGFAVGTGLSALLVEHYFDAAEEIAGRVVAEDLERLVPCASASPDRDCAASFIASFGARAFRRPITLEEQEDYLTQFDLGAEVDFATGIEATLFMFLASPKFLYHFEAPEGAATVGETARLESYGLANRLSYFLWGTMPDDELFQAAADGLDDAALEAQARRMIADPRAARALRDFGSQWLQLGALDAVDRDLEVFPEFTPDIPRRLGESVLAFVEEVFRGDNGNMRELFLADYLFADSVLASFLSLPSVAGDTFRRVSADPAQRRGILTHPALMTIHARSRQTDPVHRGVFVRERILCQALPAPPDNVAIEIPEPSPGESTRDRFTRHSTDPACRGCHGLIDPLGFGFENYDAIGRWRDEENGAPIDARGDVRASLDSDGPFDGAVELAQRLSGSAEVSECMALHWFRYAAGREPTVFDDCSLAQINAEFSASGYDFDELMVAVVKSDAFRHVFVQEGVGP